MAGRRGARARGRRPAAAVETRRMEAGATPPDQAPARPAAGRPGGWWWAGAAAVAIALAAAGWFAGKGRGEDDAKAGFKPGGAAYERIYRAGAARGYVLGKTIGRAAGQRQGRTEGEAQGARAGIERGKAEGASQGTEAGATTALGGFPEWATTPYVVSVSRGRNVPWIVTQRTAMKAKTYYSLCSGNPAAVCAIPSDRLQPAGSGGSGGSGSGGGSG